MLKFARNTLASIEESADRIGSVAEGLGEDLGPVLREMATDVHRTCVDVQRAAQAHARAADLAETLLWGIVAGVALWYAYDNARELVRMLGGLARE